MSLHSRHTHIISHSVTWLIHTCDMTYPCVWYDSSMCVTWLIHMCDMTHLDTPINSRLLFHESYYTNRFRIAASLPQKKRWNKKTTKLLTEEIWLKITTTAKIWIQFSLSPRNFQTSFHGIPPNFKQVFMGVNGSPRHLKGWTGKLSNLEIQMSDLLREWTTTDAVTSMSYHVLWHDSFIRVTWLIQIWLIHMCDMTHLDLPIISRLLFPESCHSHFISHRVTWLIHTCEMTHSHVRHDSFKYDSFICVTWLI